MSFLSNIFDSFNVPIAVTNLFGTKAGKHKTLVGLPLGTSDGSATGEVCLKVLVVGAGITGGTFTSTPPSVTPTFVALGASGSQVIPIGAKGWTVTILTGTGTVGGLTVPTGFYDSDTGVLVVALTITTNAASSAYIRYNL